MTENYKYRELQKKIDKLEKSLTNKDDQISKLKKLNKTLSKSDKKAELKLKKINDEVTTQNEEIRASNEELRAVNEEFTITNEALEESYSELENINCRLIDSETKFRELSETSPTGIFIYQGDMFIYVNESTCQITGFSQKELLKMHFWDIVHPNFQAQTKKRGFERQKGEKIKERYELKLLTKNKKIKWINYCAALIDLNDKPAVIGNIMDITDNKNTLKELEKEKNKAEAADKLKSAFLANMSHEIRTPLNGIIGFTQLMSSDDINTEQRKRYAKYIKKSNDQLLRIIDDILDVSKIEVGQLKISPEKFNCNEVIDELYIIFEKQIASKKPQLNLKIYKESSDLIIETDPVRIKQIFTNLINNSVKFTEKGYIEFGYRLQNNFVEFFVKDTGIGVPEKKQNIIFDRFSQIDSSYTKNLGGTGLGLAISKGLAELLGGKIRLESVLKQGTTFYFTIPL